MTRELHTAEEIRAEVARLLNANREVPLLVPLPTPVSVRDPVEGNANWRMPRFVAHHGNKMAIGLALLDVQMRWDLKT
jgi:hypothetical protein